MHAQRKHFTKAANFRSFGFVVRLSNNGFDYYVICVFESVKNVTPFRSLCSSYPVTKYKIPFRHNVPNANSVGNAVRGFSALSRGLQFDVIYQYIITTFPLPLIMVTSN